jgi:hypothetical protein
MALPPLLVKIGADTTGLERGLGRAGQGLKNLAVIGAAAGVAVAAGLAAMTSAGLKAVDTNVKLARSMDATVNGLRAVQIAAGYAGVSQSEAATSLQQLNRELIRAAEVGTPANEALQKLGFSAANFAGIDADERAALIADRVKELGLTSGETSDIMRDLGVRSREMALLFLGGGDAIRSAREEVVSFGLELSETQTGAIERANDALARMGNVFQGLQQRLAAEVAPALEAVANKFNTLAQSDAVQSAIERLAVAFGSLAEVILSEDFIGAAISGLETMAGVAATVAEGMVVLSQNVEIVTVVLGGLAIAIALVGGPLTIVAGLLAGALIGIAAWRKEVDELDDPTISAAAAQDALNIALGTFSETGSPEARSEAIALAKDLETLASSTLAAAEANIAYIQTAIDVSNREFGSVDPNLLNIRSTREAEVDAARIELDNARRTVAGLSTAGSTPASIDGPSVPSEDSDDPEKGPLAIPGLLGAGGVTEQMAGRLDALTAGLLSEDEFLAEWYEAGRETLIEALENEKITRQEYNVLLEELEQTHQDKMLKMEKDAALEKRRAQKGAVNDLASNLSALASVSSSGAKALFRIRQAAAIANAIIDAQSAAQSSFAFGAAIGGPVLGSAFMALSYAATAAQIATIASTSMGGGGGGASRSGGSAAGATSGAAAAVASGGGGGASGGGGGSPTNVAISVQGDMFGRDQVIGLINSINEAIEDGAIVRLV